MKNNKFNSPIVLLHIVVILVAYSSPFWLDWRLVTLGVLLYFLQIILFKGCVLSLAQFNGEKKSFHEWYLTKLGLRVNRNKLRFFLNVILPPLFPLAAIVIQVVFWHIPYLKL